MHQTLLYILYFASILLIGLLSSIISRKLKIPNLLLLIGIGMGLSYIRYNGEPLLEFSNFFLTIISIMTLALIVFNSSSKFNFRKFDSMTISAFKLSAVFLILNISILSAMSYYMFKPLSIFLALIFATAISGTDPSATLMILSKAKAKIFELLKVESIINTPLVVLIPFLLLDVIKDSTNGSFVDIISTQTVPFAQQFVAGIGTGILIAFIFFRFMKKYYSATLSPLALITAALLSYSLSEALGGNGVLAVTTAGLFFGNVYHVKHPRKLQEITEVFSEIFEILVFVLLGFVIKIPFTLSFLLPASILFLAYIFIRFLSVSILFKSKEYDFKEKLYLTLNTPKGIAVAVVAFTLAIQPIANIKLVLDLIFLFMIYSIIISTVVTHFTKFFTKTDIKATEKE